MPNINDYITERTAGKCFKNINSPLEIINLVEFQAEDTEKGLTAGMRVWCPVSNSRSFLTSEQFKNYEPCSSTEIDPARELAQRSGKCTSLSLDLSKVPNADKVPHKLYDELRNHVIPRTESLTLNFEEAKKAKDVQERQKSYSKIAHLADHLTEDVQAFPVIKVDPKTK